MFWLDEGLWLVSSAMLLGIQTRRVHLGLGPRITVQHYRPPTSHSPSPRPTQTAPTLLYGWPRQRSYLHGRKV